MKSIFTAVMLVFLVALCGCAAKERTHTHQFVLKDPGRIAKSFTLTDEQGKSYELQEGFYEFSDGKYFYRAISVNSSQEGEELFDADSTITYEPAINSIVRDIMPDDVKEALAKCEADPDCTVIKKY